MKHSQEILKMKNEDQLCELQASERYRRAMDIDDDSDYESSDELTDDGSIRVRRGGKGRKCKFKPLIMEDTTGRWTLQNTGYGGSCVWEQTLDAYRDHHCTIHPPIAGTTECSTHCYLEGDAGNGTGWWLSGGAHTFYTGSEKSEAMYNLFMGVISERRCDFACSGYL